MKTGHMKFLKLSIKEHRAISAGNKWGSKDHQIYYNKM